VLTLRWGFGKFSCLSAGVLAKVLCLPARVSEFSGAYYPLGFRRILVLTIRWGFSKSLVLTTRWGFGKGLVLTR